MNFLFSGASGDWKWRQEVLLTVSLSLSLSFHFPPFGIIYELDEFFFFPFIFYFLKNIDSGSMWSILIIFAQIIPSRSFRLKDVCFLVAKQQTELKRKAINAINYIASHPKKTFYFRTESMCASKEKKYF